MVKSACMCREKYVGGPTNSVTRKELGALFDVTGTPSWRDVEGVQSATWRNYLQRLPGRAPTLFRRLGYAGESHLIRGDVIALLPSHTFTWWRTASDSALCLGLCYSQGCAQAPMFATPACGQLVGHAH